MEKRYVVFEMWEDGESDNLESFDNLQDAYDRARALCYKLVTEKCWSTWRAFRRYGVADTVSRQTIYPRSH